MPSICHSHSSTGKEQYLSPSLLMDIMSWYWLCLCLPAVNTCTGRRERCMPMWVEEHGCCAGWFAHTLPHMPRSRTRTLYRCFTATWTHHLQRLAATTCSGAGIAG